MRTKGRNRPAVAGLFGVNTPLVAELRRFLGLGDEILGRPEPALRAGSDAADIA